MRAQEHFGIRVGHIVVLDLFKTCLHGLIRALHFVCQFGFRREVFDLQKLIGLSDTCFGSAAAEHGDRYRMIFCIRKVLIDPFCSELCEAVSQIRFIGNHQYVILAGRSHKVNDLDSCIHSGLYNIVHRFRGNRPENEHIHAHGDIVFTGFDLGSRVELAVSVRSVPACFLELLNISVCQLLEEVAAKAERDKTYALLVFFRISRCSHTGSHADCQSCRQ